MTTRERDLQRIAAGLDAAAAMLRGHAAGELGVERKAGGDPVTAADREVDALLREMLPRTEEGWLSEETPDDRTRLDRQRVWIVDPLDGTREFVAGLPEWSVSIALADGGVPVAGGVCNPATGETFLGSVETGVTMNGEPARPRPCARPEGAVVLASRWEVENGKWQRFEELGFEVRPVGSIAYKLALVAAGRADATWTVDPRHEWDVAAGVALVRAAGGVVTTRAGREVVLNQPRPVYDGVIALSAAAAETFAGVLARLR